MGVLSNATISPTIEPHFIIDKQGNKTFAILPIDDYNCLIEDYNHLKSILKSYEDEAYIPNEETIKAIEQGLEEKKNGLLKGYTDIHQMFADILNDEEDDEQ